MYFYSFLADYEIDTILYSNKKWTNEETNRYAFNCVAVFLWFHEKILQIVRLF